MSSGWWWCLLTWLALPLGDLYGVCQKSIRTDVDGSVAKTTTVMARLLLSFALAGKWAPARQGPTGREMESPLTLHYLHAEQRRVRMSSCVATFGLAVVFLPCHVWLHSSTSGIPCVVLVHICLVLYIPALPGGMPFSRNVSASRNVVTPLMFVCLPKGKLFCFLVHMQCNI